MVFAAYRGERQQREIATANAVKPKRILAKARRAVDDMYTGVAERWLEQQGKLTDLQREFLEKALAFYEESSKDEGATPEVRNEAAIALAAGGGDPSEAGKDRGGRGGLQGSDPAERRTRGEHPDTRSSALNWPPVGSSLVAGPTVDRPNSRQTGRLILANAG